MALATIVNDTELQNALGTNASPDWDLLVQERDWVEKMVRAYVRHNITQPTSDYTEFYPRRAQVATAETEQFELVSNRVVSQTTRSVRNVIVLSQKFARTITNVWEDLSAYYGKGSGDFASSTLLVDGTDYVLEQTSADLSPTSRLQRIGRSWPTTPGTVKVQYMAGLTSSELDDEYQFVKLAILDEVILRYYIRRSQIDRAGPGAGPIASHSISGDFTERYDTTAINAAMLGMLSPSTKQRLQPIRHRLVSL